MASWKNPVIDSNEVQIWFTGEAGGEPCEPPKNERFFFIAQYSITTDVIVGRWYPMSEGQLWLAVMKRAPYLPGSSPDGAIVNA